MQSTDQNAGQLAFNSQTSQEGRGFHRLNLGLRRAWLAHRIPLTRQKKKAHGGILMTEKWVTGNQGGIDYYSETGVPRQALQNVIYGED